MTKEGKIKDEYVKELSNDVIDKKIALKFYKNLAPYIDENGWIDSESSNGYAGYIMGSELETKFPFIRLKSLQGIEDNAGWTKINSEEDLPKENCDVWIVSDKTTP